MLRNNDASSTFSGVLEEQFGRAQPYQVGYGSSGPDRQHHCRRGNDGLRQLLVAGAANALSRYSDVSVNGGVLDVSGYANTVRSLTISSGTLNLNLADTLTAANGVALGGTIEIAGTADNSIGNYTLITGGSAISGSIAGAIVAAPDPNFALKLDATHRNLVYQHLATLDTPTLTAASPTIITGGTTTLLAGFRNSAPTNLSTSATLAVLDHSNASLSLTANETTQSIWCSRGLCQ